MGLYATMERGPQSAGMYTVHEFRHSKPVLSLANPSAQLIRQSQATCLSVGRAAWRMVSQFSLGSSSFLCTQCDTKCRVALLEGMPSSSTVFCPRSCPGGLSRNKLVILRRLDLTQPQVCGDHPTMPTARPGPTGRTRSRWTW